jgi:two-component system NtrC family sensor kinase
MCAQQQAVKATMEFDDDVLSPFLDCLPLPAFAVDESGIVIAANRAMKPLLFERLGNGRGRLEDLLPEYCRALGNPRGWGHEKGVDVVRKLADGSAAYERLWLCRHPGGPYVVTVTDETRVRTLEASSAQSARLASLGFMVASVCHEVSNPLAAVHSMVQILQANRDASRELVDKGLANIGANVKRILELSRKLTGYCRVGDQPKRVFHVDDALIDALAQARQDRLCDQVDFEHCPDPDALVFGNQGEIQEVFFNILLNAVQAMEGRGRIAIATRVRATGTVEVAIRDNGPGVAPEHQTRLFEPFFTTKPVGQGTGLGLAISGEIVREHGGTIHVENNATQGACFFVEIPLSEAGR